MPYPLLKKPTHEQYLELEKNFLNLFNFVQSLLTITEGEDLENNDMKLSHFNALCIRLNEGVEQYSKFTEKVRGNQFQGDSANLLASEPSQIVIKCNREEHKKIIEALEHIANGFPDLKTSDEFQKIADDLKNLKRSK
tara:strand:- start:1046 stop:1459 length:414 start_codon:yes stop_codon:yes gene_type:complete